MSKNHQLFGISDTIEKRYKKTVLNALSGYRVDPYNPGKKLSWLLSTPESALEFSVGDNGRLEFKRTSFSYDDEVIELYNSNDVKTFERFNRVYIENGALAEYTEDAPELDTTNVLTDKNLIELANVKQLLSFRKKINTLDSIATVLRLRDTVIELDRPHSFVETVDARINELSRDHS